MIGETETVVDVAGRSVRLTTLDRLLWPELGFTKAHLLDYYARIAPVLLPHLVNRPVTLRRFPEGVDGKNFFQTRTPSHPPWVRVQRMWTFPSGKDVDAPVVDDAAGLMWAANLSTIEFHPYLSTVDALDRPTTMVFDLDPGAPAGLLTACAVALDVRDRLEGVGLRPRVKVSGAKGIHILVPVKDATYDDTKLFARTVAAVLEREMPERVVARMTRSLRVGKVLVDWSQNDAGKSTVAPYSLRAGRYPTVAMPVTWDEVATAVADADERMLRFLPDDALARVAAHGDLFSQLDPQVLPATTVTP